MRKLMRGRFAAVLLYGLALAVALPALGAYAATGPVETAKAKVVVLPLANNTEVGGADLAGRVHLALRLALEASGRANAINLRASNPAVQRALNVEKSLEPGDLDITPPATAVQATRIGRALGADVVLWGSIDEYAFDQKTGSATVGLSLQKLDLRTNASTAIVVSGKSTPKVGFVSSDEGALTKEAVDSAVGQAVQRVVGGASAASAAAPVPASSTPSVNKKSKSWQTLGALLAIGAVVAIASSSGGGGAPAAPTSSVVTNAVATPTANSVNLSWQVASTATSISNFLVYRAEMGQVSRMARAMRAPMGRVRATTRQAGGYTVLANIGRSDRSYSDTSAVTGTLYAYRITTVARNAESTPVDLFNFYEPLGTRDVGPDYPSAPAMPSVSFFVSSALVQWTANPEPFIDSYRVLRATSASGPWTLVGTATADQTSVTDPGPLTPAAVYYYAVAAVTGATGANGRMGPARQVTFAVGKPAPPSNVVARALVGGVEISWDPSPDTSVTAYRVFRNGTMVREVAGRTTVSWTNSPLAAGSYAYAVASVASGVESDRVAATPPTISPSNPPSTLVITKPVSVVANGASSVNIVATARDAGGSPVAGVNVTFSLAGGGGTLTAPLIRPTSVAGAATIPFQAGTDASAIPVVTATCAGVSGTLSDSVTITLEQPHAATVTLTAGSATLVGDGISSTTLTATVTDQGGGPVAGQTVHFESQNPGLGIIDPTKVDVVTGPDGTAQSTLTSTAAGQFGSCTVTATAVGAPVGTLPGQVVVRFVAAPQLSVSVDPNVLPAAGMGASALITATAKYIGGDPVAENTVIRFAFEGGQTISDTGARIVSGRERALTRSGIAYSTMFSAVDLTHGNSDVIWAWIDLNDNGVWDGPSETLGTTVVSYTDPPYRVTVTANPLSIPAGRSSVSKIVADVRTQVTDPSGGGLKPVADGTLITFSTTAGQFAETSATTVSARTVGGLATVFLQSGSVVETANVTATAALISGSVQVEFTAPVNVVVQVSAAPASLLADGAATSQILVRVHDNSGSALPSNAVILTTDIGSLSASSLITDVNGEARATFTAGRTAGTATVLAVTGGATGFTTLTLTSGQAQNLSMTVFVPNFSMPATNGFPSPSGASPTATVSARVTDTNGNPVVDGTPVFFHTDIGQITGSVPTSSGVASATLTTGNFLDATNKATYRPGWASITAYADNPSTAAKAGPAHAIFSGDVTRVNWDGSANDTNFWTDGGADWRLGLTGGSPQDQPNLTPVAGGEILPLFQLADANNNPLPSGINLVWEVSIGASRVATLTHTTALGGTSRGSTGFTVNRFPAPYDNSTAALVTFVAVPPIIISETPLFTIRQWVGAAPPAGTVTMVSVSGSPLQIPVGGPGGPWMMTATLTDKFGNFVQDGTVVYLEAQNAVNIRGVTFSPNPVTTVGGTATFTISVELLSNAVAGSLTVFAGSPQGGPSSDAKGTIGLAFNPPPGGGVLFQISYTDANAVLTQTYPIGPGLQVISNAFSITNIGTQAGTIYVSNVPDAATYPFQYITFREHSADPPAVGADPLPIAVAASAQVWVDVIVKTDGLNAVDSPYGSQIGLLTPAPGTITYLPVVNPQRISISVQ